ncbi:MAG: beta-phosphoglucomutase [Phycisphaerales bacterium]|nr:beta-phosphoglucomutase [Phycisphaerales bacterium]
MKARRAVIFDLDGVLTDTAELHYLSWQDVATDLRVPYDRAVNEGLRGLSREESLRIVLGDRWGEFDPARRADIMRVKNDRYLARVAAMTPADAFDGIPALLDALRNAGAALAVASSSRNARAVLERIGLAAAFDAVVDGNDAPRSKPDPQVFTAAAAQLAVPAPRCVVVEDAAAGVQAARAAGMRVVGVGPAERVGGADLVVPTPASLRADVLLALLPVV